MANSSNGDFVFNPMEKKDCSFFVQYGTCSYGQNCKYNHPPHDDSAVVKEGMTKTMYADYTRKIPCKFFRSGFCMYGAKCDFNHSMPNPPLQYNSDELPMRMGVPLCSFYLHNRWCGYGAGCKFHHPELYFVSQEYGSHASGQAQEYGDELLGSDDGNYYPLSVTNSPQLLSNYAHDGNQ
ncbi:zinc finger CCCH domain-containing protein 66-like [Helianthus annuus]|uniref:zinc finger CCCH domain-containing protein 66-like n=1 Tax=Helianthus annuus TaxID=4232 RepID=UPI001652BBFC|nr:zinc finger CCCH domain-containing protein 66-like [Helianthus annuus]